MATPSNLLQPLPSQTPLQLQETSTTDSLTPAFNNHAFSTSSVEPNPALDKGCLEQVFDAVAEFLISLWQKFCYWICPKNTTATTSHVPSHIDSSDHSGIQDNILITPSTPPQPLPEPEQSDVDGLLLPVVNFGSSSTSYRKNVVLKQHRTEYTTLIMKAVGSMNRDAAGIITDFVVEGAFDREKWRERYGVDIGEEPALPFIPFYQFYHGKNPIDVMNGVPEHKIDQVCQSCIAPYIRPERVTHLSSNQTEDFSLNVLGCLVENPREGYPSRYSYETEALLQHGSTKAGRSVWVVALEDVVAIGETWDDQVAYLNRLNTTTGAQCIPPTTLTVVTGVFSHQNETNKRLLSGDINVYGDHTYSRAVEKVTYDENDSCQVIIGENIPLGFNTGGPFFGPSGGLNVTENDFSNADVGVMVLREFPAIRPLA